MKKNKVSTTLLIIVGVALLIIGGLFLNREIISGFFAGKNSENNTGISRENSMGTSTDLGDYFEYDKISSIDIDVSIFDITLVPSDKYALEYSVSDEKFIPEISMTGGKLKISSFKNEGINFDFSIFNNIENSLTIYFPKGASFSDVLILSDIGEIDISEITTKDFEIGADMGAVSLLDIKATSMIINASMGAVKTNNIETDKLEIRADMGAILCENLSSSFTFIKASMGAVDISGAKSETLEIDCSLGEVKLKRSVITSSLIVNNDSGAFYFSDIEAKNVEINASLGKVEGTGLVIEGIKIKNSSGSTTLEGDITGDIDIDCDLGSVLLDLDRAREEYNIIAETDLGTLKINGMKEEGDLSEDNGAKNSLNIYCSSGGIDINFL